MSQEIQSPPLKSFSIIVASTLEGGIGYKGQLPWPKIKKDLAFFRQTTTEAKQGKQNIVIMGRKTWESLPVSSLPMRTIIVLSRSCKTLKGVEHLTTSLDKALELACSFSNVDRIFVMGGGQVYAQALESKQCQSIYWTHITKEYPADTYFTIPPKILGAFSCTSITPLDEYVSVHLYQRKT